jgi:hypothetical protein
MRLTFLRLLCTLAAVTFMAPAGAAEGIQPYVLAYTTEGKIADEVIKLREKLKRAGFTIAGEYSPYAGAYVIGISSDALLKAVAEEPYGGFAAAEHVAVTSVKGKLQVSYLNPPYLAAAYRLKTDLADVATSLGQALGAESHFGTKAGRAAAALKDYRYMFGMETVADFYQLGGHRSYQDAVKTVEANLRKGVAGAGLVYKIELPGKQQTVFGVSFAKASDQRVNDKHVMADTVDQKFEVKTTAYQPYQILVNGKNVIAQHMRFHMAVWHPDLTMVTFGKLITSPGAYEERFSEIAAGEKKSEFKF